MKCVLFLAFVGLAVATDVSNVIVDGDEDNADAIKNIGNTLDNVNESVSGVAGSAGDVAKKMISVDALIGNAAELDAKLPSIAKMLKMQASQTDDELAYQLAVAKGQQEIRLAQEIGNLHSDVSMKTTELEQQVSNLAEDTAVTAKSLSASTKTLLDRLSEHKKCASKLQLYDADSGECRDVAIDPSTLTREVTHRMFNNDDGRDSGYLNGRWIRFTKKHDATFMRVWYHDNMRVHGHTAHGRWNIMVCDVNGNGCDHCNNPARLQYWRYSNHQHNWWMNDHWAGGIAGLCKSAGNRDMKKGRYQFRVMIDSNRYDMYTGHNTHSMLMVDEVMKL